MPVIQLQHYAKLSYPAARDLPRLPREIEMLGREVSLVSFRASTTNGPDEVRKNIHACVRLIDLPVGDLVFFGLESDSPLAPLILWDVAHFLPVGQSISMLGDSCGEAYLERAYFQKSLVVERKDTLGVVLRKTRPLPAERDAGLDRWSFCIPVGPDDATLLNVVVKRILELDVPEKEILLCGRPGSNFIYWDRVRIVGEDITAPPVQICKKKNRLAEEARYENLCILHDRVFLPKDFYSAVREFGDCYPFTAFQSLYFDDLWNLVPRRYSDFGKVGAALASGIHGFHRNPGHGTLGPFSATVFSELELSGFVCANPIRHSPDANYLTGSLYVTKKSVWEQCPQDDHLNWIEFEDIEHAVRAAKMGMPSRINQFAFTQSISARPILAFAGSVAAESCSGRNMSYRPLLEAFPFPRKPLLRLSEQQGLQHLADFRRKHSNCLQPTTSRLALVNSDQRLTSVVRLVNEASIPIRMNAIQAFLADFERHILCDQFLHYRREFVAKELMVHGDAARVHLLRENGELLNQVTQRPRRSCFCDSPMDYLPLRGFVTTIGSFVSALLLGFTHREAFYFPGGFWKRFKVILNSTPYRDYAKDNP